MSRYYSKHDDAIKTFFAQCKDCTDMAGRLISGHRPTIMGKRFMTDAQLSDHLNISRRTLQQYRDSGRIAFYRLDGKILYDEDDVRDFLALSYRPKFEDWGT